MELVQAEAGIVEIKASTTVRECDPSTISLGLAQAYSEAFSGGAWQETHDPTELSEKLVQARDLYASRLLVCSYGTKQVAGAQFLQLGRYQTIASQLPRELLSGHYLNDLWVAPSHQSLGLGSKLLDCVEQAVASLSSNLLVLWTHADHAPLLKFYQNRGYEPVVDVQPKDGTAKRRVFAKPIFVIKRSVA